jgi:hypothetical protein
MSAAEDLLKAFAADRGLADFAPDADGHAGLRVGDGGVPVDLKADGDRLYVYGSLGALPQANEEAVLTLLLAANRAGAACRGPIMSVDPTLGDVVLSQELDARTASSATLLRTVGTVAEQLQAWHQHLGEIDALLKGDGEQSGEETPLDRMTHLMNRA